MKSGDVDYEFENIEALTKKSIAEARGPKGPSRKQITDVKSSISTEVARVKKSFALKVLSFEATRQAELFVRYHQFLLINLLDELFDHFGSPNSKQKSNPIEPIKEIELLLENLLHFIHSTFPAYFDLNSDVPNSTKEKVLLAVKDGSDTLEVTLTRFSIDPGLGVAVLSVFADLLKAHEHRITFRQITCVEALTSQLLELTSNTSQGSSIDNQVREILLKVDCNQTTCVGHYLHFLAKELSASETISDRLERLAFHYKTINQVRTRQDLRFNDEIPSLKTLVSEWLVEEIAFYERKLELNLSPTGKPDELITKDFKLIFDLSVSQFAYFIKVLMETGVIQNKNLSELIRFLVKFTKTKKSENVSFESFRIKYYNVESNTKGAVSNLFHTSIGHINNG